MPDDLDDRFSEDEMKQAFAETIKSPSKGAMWFSWDAALEKNKTEIIRNMFLYT